MMVEHSSDKSGMVPGSLVYVGKNRPEHDVQIDLIQYDQSGVQRKLFSSIEECSDAIDPSKVNWLRLNGVHDVDLIHRLGKLFKIHALTLEDLLNTNQRPKVEVHEDYIYVDIKKIDYQRSEQSIVKEQIGIIFLKNVIITFQELPGRYFEGLENRLNNDNGLLRQKSSDYLFYALVDSIIDNYFSVIEKLEDDVEELEETLETNSNSLQEIQILKKNILKARRSIFPVRDVILILMKEDLKMVSPQVRPYFRDIYDHYIQVYESIDLIREVVGGMIEIHLSIVSNRMNEIMKYLTVFTSIFIPLTFITGIYGMNFHNMPELSWEYGYYIVLAILFSIGAILFYFFKRKRWL